MLERLTAALRYPACKDGSVFPNRDFAFQEMPHSFVLTRTSGLTKRAQGLVRLVGGGRFRKRVDMQL